MPKKRIAFLLAAVLLFCIAASGCTDRKTAVGSDPSSENVASERYAADESDTLGAEVSSDAASATVSEMDFGYTDRDLDANRSTAGATVITLKTNSISVNGSGASVSGGVVTITSAGTYTVSGTLLNGQIVVAAGKEDKVQLVFHGVRITCADHAPVYIKSADKVFITLSAKTENSLTDGSSYTLSEADSTVDGALFSKADLTLNGSGSLTVKANYRHGIVSKDDLVVTGGVYDITAAGDGLQGKDCIKINDGTFTVNAGADGMKSNNDEDASKGFVSIDGGKFAITAANDGIQAETVLRITKADITMKTGGGSANASTDSKGEERPGWGFWGNRSDSSADTESAKGLKASGDMILSGGSFQIDSSDDSVHSNGSITISGGSFALSSGDDGIHADANLTVSNGTINITKSYEGLEGKSIDLKGGTIHLVASDDGINAAGGNDSSSMGGRPGQNRFQSEGSSYLSISGGYVVVNASGDGIDVNGSLLISGGTVLVNGPTSDGDGGLDYDGTAKITGGTVIVVGSAGMAQGFGTSSTQCSFSYTFSSTQSAAQPLSITDSSGKVIASFMPMKSYRNIVVSTPALALKSTYSVYAGGTVSGTDSDGFTASGSLSGGTKVTDITLSSVCTSVNTQGGMGGGMGGMGGMGGRR